MDETIIIEHADDLSFEYLDGTRPDFWASPEQQGRPSPDPGKPVDVWEDKTGDRGQ